MQTQAKTGVKTVTKKPYNQRELEHLEKVLTIGRRLQELRAGLEMYEELHAKRRAQLVSDIESAQHEFDLLQEAAS